MSKLVRAWKQLAKRQRRALWPGRAESAYEHEITTLSGQCDQALAHLERANQQVTELQTRGTELLLENRELRLRQQAEIVPRRQLWVSCGQCHARAPHPSGIVHKPGCAPVKLSGNGATP